MEKQLATQVLPKQLAFTPGGPPSAFAVEVVNHSDRYASFQLEVSAAGTNHLAGRKWYHVSPDISSKNPPGDTTQFQIEITDSPVPGFVGLMSLAVRVFSIELQEEERESLKLTLAQGTGAVPLGLNLPVEDFDADPGEEIQIPVWVSNPSQLKTTATVSLQGIDASWFPEGNEQTVKLAPGGRVQTTFNCKVPADPVQAPSHGYRFQVEASHAYGPPTQIEGHLKIDPLGFVVFQAQPEEHCIPEQFQMKFWQSPPVIYELKFENNSNLYQHAHAEIVEPPPHCTFEVMPDNIKLGLGDSGKLSLIAEADRHWLGFSKRHTIQVEAVWSNVERIDSRDETHVLQLKVKPRIPLWLVILMALVGGVWLWWISPFNQYNRNYGHRGAVTSVAFNGIADQAVSSSNDTTAIRWSVQGLSAWWAFPYLENIIQRGRQLAQQQKAIRGITYRPVNNDLVAVGLENGQIQLWDLNTDHTDPLQTFSYEKADRVLDVEFSQDSRYLFSSHGSGTIVVWATQRTAQQRKIFKEQKMPFAIYDSVLLGNPDQWLAIAGQQNQLVLWNWQSKQALEALIYPESGTNRDYIQSIDTARDTPTLLTTADTQGNITLWNLAPCLQDSTTCKTLKPEIWSHSEANQPVRSVSMSDDGCYLASGGDDGRVMLWPLLPNGQRDPEFREGIELYEPSTVSMANFFQNILHPRSSDRINSVDLKVIGSKILVLSGSDDTQVRLFSTTVKDVQARIQRQTLPCGKP